MAWDLALDGGSGDFIFGPSRDLLGVTGTELVNQRILIRCGIPRGSFLYDETLGSRLQEISRQPSERQLREAPTLVQEALEPMDDIRVTSINVEITEDNRLFLDVQWQPIVSDNEVQASPDEIPTFDAKVTI